MTRDSGPRARGPTHFRIAASVGGRDTLRRLLDALDIRISVCATETTWF